MTLSIIIPVYNEEETITKILSKVIALTLPSINFKEIIIVDDGSTDSTALKIQKIKSDFPNIIIQKHSRNLGKGAAVITGIKNATGEYVFIQDADLEYDPKYLKSLLEPIHKNLTQVSYGTRLNRLPHLKNEERTIRFIFHYFGNRFLSLLVSILYGQWLTDVETCYKIFPKNVLNHFSLNARGFEFEPEITSKLLKNGYKIMEIPITTTPRGYNEGKKLKTFPDGFKAMLTILKYRFVD